MSSQGFNPFEGDRVAKAEDQGQWIELTDEVGDPMLYGEDGAEKPVKVLVAGTYSGRYRRAEEARNDRFALRKKKLTGPALAREALEMVAACVIDWDGFICPDPDRPGEMMKMPCAKEKVLVVLQTCPWIREQVESTMQDHEGFFKKS